ncbi:tyrosine--tRNA ligase [Parasegetibacter sp. NRK P23]|uniref:tyrosine--tRNA ligase n=1 Tax=Parasegetibacter sp. NRK P23 TaxID=2942999 RepID=UPI0020433AFB|nr:tyrosine--tRNA ligase [Parasegetibacter sp. NRK P23]MCM5527082.1 tyrosine--tRNA ligase [Parasegetibacter sp. NRK P23]
MDLVAELRWRGMFHDMTPGTDAQLNKEMTTGYIGFDPTADSLHIGSLVPILMLVHLQRAGHKPIALVGGATGMVGDPSFKAEERKMLDEDALQKNLAGIRAQLEKFLNFDPSLPNAAEMANNYDWFKDFSFLDFIRVVGKHITVNYMMAKDSVKKRIEGDSGISFTEFTYQLIQGYDYVWLNKHKNCKIQMGGSDQWGNITTGTELIRRMGGSDAFALTCPLVTKTDGSKFGKSEQGNVWLDPAKTSPFHFYQFWLNASDADAEKWIKLFTLLDKATCESLIEQHKADPAARLLQKRLAEEITRFVHSQEALDEALETTAKLFNAQSAPAESLSVSDLEEMNGIVKIDYAREKLATGIDPISFLAETGIFPSKGEARKMLQNGGISINRKKIEDMTTPVMEDMLLHNTYLLVQKGKKNYYLVKFS